MLYEGALNAALFLVFFLPRPVCSARRKVFLIVANLGSRDRMPAG